MLIDETNLVQERENARISTEAILLQLAAGSILSTKAGKVFTKTLNGLAKEAVVRVRSGDTDGSQGR
jgi:hypothetical protein